MDILGLSTSPSSGGAYALILTEVEGNRRLPIIIGSFEAQAIALELENIKPPRPMTHDLLKNMILGFDAKIDHIYVNELKEGTFFAQIILKKNGAITELDARPSDAIALAVRFNADIYVNGEVLNEAGIAADPETEVIREKSDSDSGVPEAGKKELSQMEQLEQELRTAIETENYEKAAKIRDRIQKLKG